MSALESYYVRPKTVDRVRGTWLGPQIERYVERLAAERYSRSTILRTIRTLTEFGDLAKSRGAHCLEDLPSHVEGFLTHYLDCHGDKSQSRRRRGTLFAHAHAHVEGMLRLVLPGFAGGKITLERPFQESVPTLFDHLQGERGYRATTILRYVHHLRSLEQFLQRIGVSSLSEVSPMMVSAFLAESARRLGPNSMQGRGGVLRIFFRYLHRQGMTAHDLSHAVERGRRYRQASLPRAITWVEVQRVLDAVDRRAPVGKRDYVILLLLVTYGLRSREVEALTLDGIDWKRERLLIPARKGDHSTAFPLSTAVGEALLEYIRDARPSLADRHVFFRAVPPIAPLAWVAIGQIASRWLRRAGIAVPRGGSHTLRHTCVQQLVNAGFSFKAIGDYVGHRSPQSTQVYGKVAVEALRELAMGNGEEVL